MCYSDYAVKTCEKIDLNIRNSTWEALPDMVEARSSFNPCLFTEYVYLCGYYSGLVEVFSPQTDSFLPFQLQLPEVSNCCVYVHNNSLVVHSYGYLTQFSAGQAGHLIPLSQSCCPTPISKYSNCHPVLHPTRSLFFLFQECECVSFKMETGVLVQEFS